MSAAIDSIPQQTQNGLSQNDLGTLRQLLLGPEYQDLLQHKATLEDSELLAKRISLVITQALELRSTNDDSVQKFFTPILEKSLSETVSKDPKPIADALYPVIAPAIRKSINASLTQLINNINELLENSFSPKSLRWRFDSWRSGKSYAEVAITNQFVYQVEQVFLIHRKTGLLLQHVEASTSVSKDPDIVSSMLTAIQDFLSDSFQTETNSDLDSLKLGDLTVLIEHSPTTVLATVIRGIPPSNLRLKLSETLEGIHQNQHMQLANYNGDISQFEHLQETLSSCLSKQSRKVDKVNKDYSGLSKKKAFLAATAIVFAPPSISYLGYSHYAEAHQWKVLQQALRSEPGITLSHASYENGAYQIFGLADPLATPPMALINKHAQGKFSVESNFQPYLSLEPTLVLKRIQKTLLPPDTVNLALKAETLHINGTADKNWINQLKQNAKLFAGIDAIHIDKLQTTSTQ